jgi:hypothetical protein
MVAWQTGRAFLNPPGNSHNGRIETKRCERNFFDSH